MSSVNLAVISGNLVNDVKLKQSEKGSWYAFCRVAVWMTPTYTAFLDFQKFWKTYEDAEKQTSQWQKGNTVLVQGTISNYSKVMSDGSKANSCVINAYKVTVVRISKKNSEAANDEDDLFAYEDGDSPIGDDDEISF